MSKMSLIGMSALLAGGLYLVLTHERPGSLTAIEFKTTTINHTEYTVNETVVHNHPPLPTQSEVDEEKPSENDPVIDEVEVVRDIENIADEMEEEFSAFLEDLGV